MEDSFLYSPEQDQIHRDKMHLTVIHRVHESPDDTGKRIERKLFQIFQKYDDTPREGGRYGL